MLWNTRPALRTYCTGLKRKAGICCNRVYCRKVVVLFFFSTQKTAFEVSTTKSAKLMETFDDLYQNVFISHPLREPIASSKIVDEVVNHDLIKAVLGVVIDNDAYRFCHFLYISRLTCIDFSIFYTY